MVNGDDVTATGLFVEHFQKYNVIWNGERGKTIFFQNELPYDAPEPGRLAARRCPRLGGVQGGDRVKTERALGRRAATSTPTSTRRCTPRTAFEVPVTPGVQLHDLLTVNLGAGTIDHVVNDTGDAATTAHVGTPVYVVTAP